jgi:uncharacterized protein
MHEARLFELSGSLSVEVQFVATPEEAAQLLEQLHREKVRLFYARLPAAFGAINPDADDSPALTRDA